MAEMRSTGAAPAPAPQTELENLPGLISRLGEDVMKLLDTKLALAKVEIKEDAVSLARSGMTMGAGALVAAVGFALLNVAVAFFISMMFSFSQPMNYALGFVITGALYLVIGGAVIMMVKNRMANRDLIPNRSIDELRKDKEWLKKEI
jgi:uncharacterized membrane protein YqjE